MAIPDFQSIMLPLLRYLSDEKEHHMLDVHDALAKEFGLTEEELKELLPSGQDSVFRNRVGWARTYLKKAGLIEPTRRGYYKITERGKKVLEEKPSKIDIKYLTRFPEFIEFRETRREREKASENEIIDQSNLLSPEETIERAYQAMIKDLAEELLQYVKKCSPAFFEKLVVDLLLSMGYGGTKKDAGEAIGRSGDEGIDGIIKEDRLGLDIVYIQAKRWENPVSRPEIQKFAGALQGQRAKKGIFITTSSFTKEARDYAEKIDSKIVLIDGEKLAELMIEHNIGVSLVSSYQIKKIDQDYFSEE
ncbi:MAG: restriction endonuclease [Candidatus Aminicenantes bacterium]|nr:restriction endonuclease [Candidatus Aminicenantes bacterium]